VVGGTTGPTRLSAAARSSAISAEWIEFMPLEEAVVQYRRGRALILEDDATADDDWPPTWFPITRQGHGDVVVCDCGASGDVSTIHLVVWEEPSPEPAAASFGDMVWLWVEAIDAKRWVYDADNRRWYADDVEVAGSRIHRSSEHKRRKPLAARPRGCRITASRQPSTSRRDGQRRLSLSLTYRPGRLRSHRSRTTRACRWCAGLRAPRARARRLRAEAPR
jgi:hypothetical protein